MLRPPVLFALVLCFASCRRETPAAPPAPTVNEAAADFANLCNALDRSETANITDPAERATRIADWLNTHLRTEQARRTLNGLATVEPAQRGAILRRAADEAGYHGPCPMADGH